MLGCLVIFMLSLCSVVVKNIVMERIQSRSGKLCETLENKYKLDSENLAILKRNEENLIKAYYTASLPHLNNIEVITFKR